MSEDRIVLRGIPCNHPKSATDFIQKVIALHEQGYELITEPKTVRERASFVGFPTCVMVRKGEQAEVVDEKPEVDDSQETPEEAPEQVVDETSDSEPTDSEEDAEKEQPSLSVEEELASLSKKADLLKFAADSGIEVPDDIKVPLAIKKFLVETISR